MSEPGVGRPTLTVQLPSHATYGNWLTDDWTRLLELARVAESVGVDRVAVVDHVVMGRDMGQYVWADVQLPPDVAWLEPIALLTWVAGATTTLRLSTRILIAPLRPAPLLAKAAATLDVLSGGRLDLGVGTGWQREEYEAQGLDFNRRGELLTTTMAACRSLWSDLPATYHAATVDFTDVYCAPRPHQERLPVWFGGTLHRRNLERIVTLGDGWIPIMQADLATVAAGAAALGAAAPARSFGVQAELAVVRRPDDRPDPHGTLSGVAEWVAAGATDVFVSLASLAPDPGDAVATMAAVGQRFHRELP